MLVESCSQAKATTSAFPRPSCTGGVSWNGSLLTGLCLPSIEKFSSRDLRTDRPAGPLNAARPAKGRAEPRLSRSQAAVQRRAEDPRGATGALPARCWAAGPPAPLRSRPQARLRPGPASCLPPRPR